MKKILISKELLTKLYITQHLSTKAIANELGVSRQTVTNKLREFNIEVRPRREPKPKKKRLKRIERYKNRDEFQKVYSRLKSINLVAEYFNTSVDTAYNWKNKHGIETINKISDKALWKAREDKPYCNKELLASMYAKYSTPELARMWNCDATTIQNWMRRFGIKTRSYSEQWDFKSRNGVRVVDRDFNFDLHAYKEQIVLS